MGLNLLLVLSSYMLLTQIAEGNSDDFDCVDIYKQPAFQHPLLKNHKIQEKFSIDENLDEPFRIDENFNGKKKYEFFDESCPKGTVPILRQKNGLEKIHVDSSEYPRLHFATVETVKDGTIYRGGEASISIYDVAVKKNQYSKSQIWVENGPRLQLNSIEAGWAVHPNLYGDSLTRLTIRWTVDGHRKTGCYNTDCPGFVISSEIPAIGSVLQSSIHPNITYLLGAEIFQDKFSGNWPLKIGNTIIGYWPKELFTHLNKGASLVRFGGTTLASLDGLSPPMGNGRFPVIDFRKSSYYQHVQVRNSSYQLVDIRDMKIRRYADSPQCYKVSPWTYGRVSDILFSFGGPGGRCGF